MPDPRFLQAPVREFARSRIPWSLTEELVCLAVSLNFIVGETARFDLRVREGWMSNRNFTVALEDIAKSSTISKRGRLLAERFEF